jgi:hypothetical protein
VGGFLPSLLNVISDSSTDAGYSGPAMRIDDYFANLERSLSENLKSGLIEDPFECVASDEFNGIIRCRVTFWDESFLDLYKLVSTELGYPIRVRYSYSFLRGHRLVFRYDNAPHHPEIVTHPHRKHIGESNRVVPSDQPTLSQAIGEINDWLSGSSTLAI